MNNSEDQLSDDERDLLRQCKQLKVTVDEIRHQKLIEAEKRFIAECEQENIIAFEEAKQAIRTKYEKKTQELVKAYQDGLNELAGAESSIQKSIINYNKILTDLKAKMAEVDKQHEQAKKVVDEIKVKTEKEWHQAVKREISARIAKESWLTQPSS